MQPFQFFSPAVLNFGAGHISQLPRHILQFGRSILILKGGQSIERSGQWQKICQMFRNNKIVWTEATITSEPSPATIDAIVNKQRSQLPDCVVSIGGGSVIDTGKAVAAMLTMPGSVKNYLEKVGHNPPENRKIPHIAIPTTSGTGSEATKNAVLSEVGPQGFKASLRHDSYIPDIALIDPELMIGCPAQVTAAAGMDTLSQLLESYFSTEATPLTDALALSGLERLSRSFPGVCNNMADNVDYRADMAYAAYISGLTLANAGLGTVHGVASVFGGYHPLPHGEICAILLAPIMKKTLDKLNESSPALEKMRHAGDLLTKRHDKNIKDGALGLINHLEWLQRETALDKFKNIALTDEDIMKISAEFGNKSNPAQLLPEDLETILKSCRTL